MSFLGKWRITSMELWEREDYDLIGPAYIKFGRRSGEFCFIAVEGEMDCRYGRRDGRPWAEFSWEGTDEGDVVDGRGWAKIEDDGTLAGRIFFHQGDDSGFTARRIGKELNPKSRVKTVSKRRPRRR